MYEKNCSSYNSPRKALHHLLNEYHPAFTKADLIALDATLENTRTQHNANIHIEKLKQMFQTAHHQNISVLLVDYHMPEMCGLDFLKEISHLPMKKALITGEKDYKIGINAFNDGLVDAYVRKDEPDFPKQVQKTITELEWKYFIELSNVVTDIPEFNYLKNNHFVPVFKQFIEENNVSAFCLTDIQGGFVMQLRQGMQKHLLVRNKTQLQELARMAREDGASVETIGNLEQGNVIPFFGDKECWQVPASEWGEYLHPANPLFGDPNIAWAAIN